MRAGYRLIDGLNVIAADPAERYAVIVRDYPIMLLARLADPIFTLSSFELLLFRDEIKVPAS